MGNEVKQFGAHPDRNDCRQKKERKKERERGFIPSARASAFPYTVAPLATCNDNYIEYRA